MKNLPLRNKPYTTNQIEFSIENYYQIDTSTDSTRFLTVSWAINISDKSVYHHITYTRRPTQQKCRSCRFHFVNQGKMLVRIFLYFCLIVGSSTTPIVVTFLTDLFTSSAKYGNCALIFVRQGENSSEDDLVGGVARGVGVVAYYNAILETDCAGNSSKIVKFGVQYNQHVSVCKMVIVTVRDVREEWLARVKRLEKNWNFY